MEILSGDTNPLVSVLMTSYNREKFIAESIESVLRSSFKNFELIVVDDKSTDKTLQVIQAYAARDSRIRYYVNEQNIGDYPNRNKAASYARGKYLKYLDADDLLYPHGLEVMVQSMEKFPEAGFGLSFSKIDDVEPYPRQIQPKDTIRSEYLGESYLGVGPSASIILRRVFEKEQGFSGKQFIGDTELWLQLGAKYPLVLFQPALNWWRQHGDQQIRQEQKNIYIPVKRLQLSLEKLQSNQHFFTETEIELAVFRKRQHFSRGMLSRLFRDRDIKRFFLLKRESGIPTKTLLSGFNRYA